MYFIHYSLKSYVCVAPRKWEADEIVAAFGRIRSQLVKTWDAETTDLVMGFFWYGPALKGKPADLLIQALGPDEEAWGIGKKPGELAWELGVLEKAVRSAPPRLVVEVDGDGLITGASIYHPR